MPNRTITLRGVSDSTLSVLRKSAARHRRSLNAEVLTILEAAATRGTPPRVSEKGAVAYPAVRLPAFDRASLGRLCRRFHIRELRVFGSHARSEARSDSDADLLVEFEPGMTPGFGMVTLADELGRVLGRPVDLVTPAGLAPRLRGRITREAVSLYRA